MSGILIVWDRAPPLAIRNNLRIILDAKENFRNLKGSLHSLICFVFSPRLFEFRKGAALSPSCWVDSQFLDFLLDFTLLFKEFFFYFQFFFFYTPLNECRLASFSS